MRFFDRLKAVKVRAHRRKAKSARVKAHWRRKPRKRTDHERGQETAGAGDRMKKGWKLLSFLRKRRRSRRRDPSAAEN